MDDDGNYVIVWVRFYDFDQPVEIYGRRFAADDTPIGPPFLINQNVTENGVPPEVSMRADGRFVVVWGSYLSASAGNVADVKMRLYAANGSPLTNELTANATTAGDQSDPEVAMAENGQFIVVWRNVDGPNASTLYARRFAANAQPLSGDLPVDTLSPRFNQGPGVALLADGGFLVVWAAQSPDTGLLDAYMRVFEADNDPAGPEKLVHDYTLSHQWPPSITPVGDGFLLAWESDNRLDQENSNGIYGRRLNGDGTFDGHEFHISNCFGADYGGPSAGGNDAGQWVVAWVGESVEGCAEHSPDVSEYNNVYAQVGPLRAYATPWFVGFDRRVNLDKTRYQPADIARFERQGQRWTMLWDASDLGITQNLKDFALLPDGRLVLAFAGSQTGVQDVGAISPHSLYLYTPEYDYGADTLGTLSLYFDGGDVGLSTNDERIDALATDWQGNLLISTVGAATVPGATAEDEDLLRFTPTSLGDVTAGSWSRAFDGSAAGVTQNLASVWVDPNSGDLFLTFATRVKPMGVIGLPSTVLRCTPSGTGCAWEAFWKGTNTGLSKRILIDGFEMRP